MSISVSLACCQTILTCILQVLTTGSWPTQTATTCTLPREVETACTRFQDFYLRTHSGRKLSWQTNMGNAGVPSAICSVNMHLYHRLLPWQFYHVEQSSMALLTGLQGAAFLLVMFKCCSSVTLHFVTCCSQIIVGQLQYQRCTGNLHDATHSVV